MENKNVTISVGKTQDCLFKDLQTALMFISERPETAFDIDIYASQTNDINENIYYCIIKDKQNPNLVIKNLEKKVINIFGHNTEKNFISLFINMETSFHQYMLPVFLNFSNVNILNDLNLPNNIHSVFNRCCFTGYLFLENLSKTPGDIQLLGCYFLKAPDTKDMYNIIHLNNCTAKIANTIVEETSQKKIHVYSPCKILFEGSTLSRNDIEFINTNASDSVITINGKNVCEVSNLKTTQKCEKNCELSNFKITHIGEYPKYTRQPYEYFYVAFSFDLKNNTNNSVSEPNRDELPIRLSLINSSGENLTGFDRIYWDDPNASCIGRGYRYEPTFKGIGPNQYNHYECVAVWAMGAENPLYIPPTGNYKFQLSLFGFLDGTPDDRAIASCNELTSNLYFIDFQPYRMYCDQNSWDGSVETMNRQIEENNRRIQEENQRIMEEQNRRLIQEQKKQEKNIQYTWHCVYCGWQIVSHDRPIIKEKCPQQGYGFHSFSK